jgi:phage gpG-like protein
MSYYTLTITPDIASALQKLEHGLNRLQIEYIEGMTEDVRVQAKQNATRGRPGLYRRSGHLADNIRAESVTGRQFGDDASITFGVDLGTVPYARIHELGGTIKPKSGGYLHFQINGRWIQARQVKIPKRPYLEPAAQQVTSVQSLRQRLELLLNSLEGRGLL